MTGKPTYKELEKRVIELEKEVKKDRRAEETLREGQYRYSLIFNGSRDSVFIAGSDAKFTDVNDAASVLTGYSKAELKRMSIPDLHEEIDLHAYETYFKSIMAGEPVLSEAKILRKDGVKVDTEFSNTRIEISGIPFMHTVARDITDRKQAEKALAESEERYRALAENSQVGFWHITVEGHTIYLNPSMCSMLEIESSEELSEQTYHPFFSTESLEIMEHERATRQKGKGSSYEVEIIGKNGGRSVVMISGAPILSTEDTLQSYIGTFTDITYRKKIEGELQGSEERLAAFMDSATDGFVLFDSELNYLKMNKAGQEITGVDKKEVIGKNVADVIPDIKETGRYYKFKKVMKTGVPLIMPDLLPHPKFGGKHLNVKVFKVGDGLGVIFTDITERKRTEEALQKAHDELDERVKELNCLYGISKIRERPDIAFEEMLRKIVDLIPPSWQYPEISCARIIIEGQEYKTKNFKETVWKQASNIVVHGKRIGILEICYLEEKSESDEGPFLKEERSLISAIAERLGRVTEHKQAEEALRKAHDELEQRVEERTKDLEIKTKSLEELNTALKVLLEKRKEDRISLEDSVLTNVKELTEPLFDKMRKTGLDDHQKMILRIIESNLNEITSPLTRKLSLKYLKLTPTEIKIANLIKHGTTTKKIAKLMNSSPRTIDTHRKNIRRKMGIEKKRANLRSYLLSID